MQLCDTWVGASVFGRSHKGVIRLIILKLLPAAVVLGLHLGNLTEAKAVLSVRIEQ